MSNKVLVTYATRYGSTQEAADEVVVALRHRGFEVDLQLMRDVRTHEGFDVAVKTSRTQASFSIKTTRSACVLLH